MASSKVKTYFCSPLCLWVVEVLAASIVTITSLSLDAVNPRANSPVHCFSREGLAVFIHMLGRHYQQL